MNWVTTTDLKRFARQNESRSILAYYIRELITATSKKNVINKIDFPYKEDVNNSGLDGELICCESTYYIPEGHSVWEFGQSNKIKGKANSDYEKRTNKPEGYDPLNSTFIFVTAHAYRNKGIWKQEKINLKQWKDVRFYDASDLERWFNESPVVSCQLAKEGMGSFPSTVKALDLFWDEWCCTRTITLNGKILLAGRDFEKNYTKQFLQDLIVDPGKSKRLVVKSNSNEEVIAFICAVIETMDRDEKADYYSKAIVIKDGENYDKIINKKSPHIIINSTNNLISVNYGCRENHKVILPVSNNELISPDADIELAKLEKETFINELKDLDINHEQCEKYFEETGGNLYNLKLRLI